MVRAKRFLPLTLAAVAVIACALTCAMAGDGQARGNPGLNLSTPPDDSVDLNPQTPVTVQGGAFFSASTGTPPPSGQTGNPPPPPPTAPAGGQPQWQGGRGMGGPNPNMGPGPGGAPGCPNMGPMNGPGAPGGPNNMGGPQMMMGQGGPGAAAPWMMGQSPEMMHLAQIRTFNEISFNPREAGFMAIVLLKESMPPDEQIKAMEGYLTSVKSPGLRNGIRIALIDLYKSKGDKEAVRKQAEAMLMDNDAALQQQEAAHHDVAAPKPSGGK